MERVDSLSLPKNVAHFKPAVKGYQAACINHVMSISGKLQTLNGQVLLCAQLQGIMNMETKV